MRYLGTHLGSLGPHAPPAAGLTSLGNPAKRQAPLSSAVVFRTIGLVSGLFGGLLGIGGGSAIAPILLLLGTLRPAQVSGTTLATVVAISMVGTGAYASFGHSYNFAVAWPIAVGSVAGSVLGALSSRRLSTRIMILTFLAILPYFAVKEFFPSFAAPAIATSTVSLGILGLLTGYLSGLLGISGASLVVPSLVAFFLIDHHAAQGIAMSVALSDSVAGTVTHARGRNVEFRVFLFMVGPALVGALVGVFLSNSLSASILRTVFGVFLVTVWAVMLMRFIKVTRSRRAITPRPAGVTADKLGSDGFDVARGVDQTRSG